MPIKKTFQRSQVVILVQYPPVPPKTPEIIPGLKEFEQLTLQKLFARIAKSNITV
jgi:hypothetical protein